MASARKQCDICEGKHITKEAEFWCPHCHEGFCSECNIHHSIAKLTKQHEVISISDFQKLPEYISSIVYRCEEHDKLFTNYCSQHEGLCCPECIKENHKKCDNFLLSDDVNTHSKSSALLELIQENVNSLKENYEKIITEQDKNIKVNHKQRDTILAEIQNIRKNINDHLDKLETKMNERINLAEKNIKTDISQMKDELVKRKQSVDQLENDLNVTKKHESDLQMCLGMKNFQTKLREEEQYLMLLLASGAIKTKHFKFDINEQIRAITTSVETLGTLTTEETPIPLKNVKSKRAQISSPLQTVKKSIDYINYVQDRELNVYNHRRKCNITGCVTTSDGKIILADIYNNTILFLTSDASLVKKKCYPKGSVPTDITLVGDKTICVSFYDKRLELIDTSTYKTLQVIKTDYPCPGVASDGENLIWYEQYKGIQMKHKSRDTIATLVKDNSGNFWSYLAVLNNRIYQTHKDNQTVTCYMMNGKKVWEFKDLSDKSHVRYPRCIAVDNDSNVYAASVDDNVVMLSPDGKFIKIVLSSSEGYFHPDRIYFDKIKNELLVSKSEGIIFIYNSNYQHFY